jgi:hypothetical protein
MRLIHRTPALLTGALLCALALSTPVHAQDAQDAQEPETRWPREINSPSAKIVIYQPQLESFDDVTLKARSAVSVTAGDKEPVFGAAWFTASVAVDRENNEVTLLDVAVTRAKFPNATDAQIVTFREIVEAEIPKWDLKLSLDQLVASMAAVEKEKAASAKLNHTPPEIIFSKKPAVLVMIDGDPILRDVDGQKLKTVLNTPFFIVQDGVTGVFYLKGAEAWYSGRDALGPYSAMRSDPPASVVDLAGQRVSEPSPEEAGAAQEAVADEGGPTTPVIPEVIVRTKPAEVIQTNGEPDFAPVEGTSLLYLKNSEDDVIMHIDTQEYYVLIAGRWYASKALDKNDWRYVSGDKLPTDFTKIPAGSDMADVRSNIPGTPEADEAIMDNQIPQTAMVDRKTATLDVSYDGDPKFEAIPGTKMQYAVNTDKSVLLIDGKYYCCDTAIWFQSPAPKGPWTVCVDVPKQVQDIPPESPVYNVKYVYVYDHTPDVVYVGYTPAYYGSYIYGGCVVYGTGFYYHPWYGAYYYPRPVTYGFGVHYNPWTGWGFSYGVSYGWFHVGVSTYGGFWGAGGYHYGYHHGYAHGYHRGYHQGYNRGYAAGWAAGHNAGARPQPYKRDAYRTRPTGVQPTTDRVTNRPATGQPAARPNNVYADKSGNVYRRDSNQGWQKNTQDGWKGTGGSSSRPAGKPAAQPATRPQTRPAPSQDLQRSSQSRDRGAQRSQSRPAPSRSGGRRR